MFRCPLLFCLLLLGSSVAAAEEPKGALGAVPRGPDPPTPAGGRPWIGLELQPGKAGGVSIRRVVPGSPGERAGLHPGEELLALDGHAVRTSEETVALVRGRPTGAIVRLLLADPPGREVLVKLEPRPDPVVLQRRALEGRAAPDFAPRHQLGPRVESLGSLRGRVVLLDFFATWCGPCVEALPRIQALHRELGPRGLSVVGITDEPAAVLEEVRQHGAQYTLVADGESEAGGLYHLSALPTLVVIDRAGVVRRVAVADVAEAERAVRALLPPEPPEPR